MHLQKKLNGAKSYYLKVPPLWLATFLAVCTMAPIANTIPAFANPTATFSLSPATTTVTQGSDITVTIIVNAGTNNILGVQACVTFDSAKLTYKSTDESSSAFSGATPPSNADCPTGEKQVSRYELLAPSGTLTLATMTFTATQGGSTTSLGFDNTASYIKDNATKDSNGNYVSILSGSSGTIVTANAIPPATPPAAPASETSGTGSNPTQAQPEPPKKVTPTDPAVKPAEPQMKTTVPAAANIPAVTPSQPLPQTTAVTTQHSHFALYVVGGGIIVVVLAALSATFVLLNKRKHIAT